MSALRMKNLIPVVCSSTMKLSNTVCKNQVKVASSYHMATQFRYISRTAYVAEEVKAPESSDRVKKLTEEILSLSVLEVNQLLFALQTKLGIPDSALMGGGGAAPSGGAAAAEAPVAAEPVKEKDAFNIKLGAVDQKVKIKIIKEVRAITGLGLKEAKELVEKAPVVIKEGVKKEEAEAFKKLLIDAGALVDLE